MEGLVAAGEAGQATLPVSEEMEGGAFKQCGLLLLQKGMKVPLGLHKCRDSGMESHLFAKCFLRLCATELHGQSISIKAYNTCQTIIGIMQPTKRTTNRTKMKRPNARP